MAQGEAAMIRKTAGHERGRSAPASAATLSFVALVVAMIGLLGLLPTITIARQAAVEPEVPSSDSEALRQRCIDLALTKPEIVKSQLRNVGSFEHVPLQSYTLSTQSQLWPKECEYFGRGNQARGQAFHNGRWVTMNSWRVVYISPETGKGEWPGEIANLENLQFPVCRARIQLKANVVDLSVTINEDIPWKPHHPTIAKRYFAPIPAAILPRKPKAC
jgi:hypothetical protein